MLATDRVIAFHLARLQDKNAQVRLRAIHELVLLEATGTLEALEQVYRTDPEAVVRRAAQRAGRTLYALSLRGNDRAPGR